jgi:hypothetical protein
MRAVTVSTIALRLTLKVSRRAASGPFAQVGLLYATSFPLPFSSDVKRAGSAGVELSGFLNASGMYCEKLRLAFNSFFAATVTVVDVVSSASM